MRTRETLINAALDEMACDGLFLCQLKPEGYLPTDMTTNELHEAVKSLSFGHDPYWHDEEVQALLVFLEALRMRHGIVVCECTGTDYELIHPSPDRFSRYCKLCEYRQAIPLTINPAGELTPVEPTYQSVAESRGLVPEEELQAASLAKSLAPEVPSKFREYLQNLLAMICRTLGLPRTLATSQKP